MPKAQQSNFLNSAEHWSDGPDPAMHWSHAEISVVKEVSLWFTMEKLDATMLSNTCFRFSEAEV